MRKFKIFLYAVFTLSLAALCALAAWKLLVRGERPGIVVTGIMALLLVTSLFCVLSTAAINRGRGKLVSRLWLFALALAFFYLAADFAGGLIFIRPVPFHNFPDEYVHHKMPPRSLYVLHNPESGAEIRMETNNLGFRGKDIRGKEPGTYRIVVVGDSFTLGDGLADDDAYPLITENILNDSGSGRYEVINCGVVSYTPLLEYLLLKKYIGFFKPDMVILAFDMSDLLQEYAYRKIASYDETGDVVAVDGYSEYNMRRSSLYVKALIWMRKSMFVTSAIIEILGSASGNDEVADVTVAGAVEQENRMLLIHTLDAPQPEEVSEMYGMVEDSIRRAKKLCDVHGCEFILSVYPWGHQVNDRDWLPGRYDFIPHGTRISDRTVEELRALADQNGIGFLDVFPAFRGYNGAEPLYFKNDPHWTPAGQRLMAESLARFIEEELGKGRD